VSGKVNVARRHDSALKHVTGQALYIDDMPEPPGTLHAALVLSRVACGRLVRLDSEAARAMPGVVAMLGPQDIPGRNDIAAIGKNEPLFAVDRIEFLGQTLAMVVADTLDAARAAAAKVIVEIEAEDPVVDIATALARESYVQAPATILRGDPERAMAAAPHRITGEFSVGGQEHFYLEGQIALRAARRGWRHHMSIPRPSIRPRCSTASPACARPAVQSVTVVVRRMGGGFGGKESQPPSSPASPPCGQIPAGR
jgi:xanthine dehydrogenase large subunit